MAQTATAGRQLYEYRFPVSANSKEDLVKTFENRRRIQAYFGVYRHLSVICTAVYPEWDNAKHGRGERDGTIGDEENNAVEDAKRGKKETNGAAIDILYNSPCPLIHILCDRWVPEKTQLSFM